jgi:hypothetical protein
MLMIYLPPVRPVARKSETLFTSDLLNKTMAIIMANKAKTIDQSK